MMIVLRLVAELLFVVFSALITNDFLRRVPDLCKRIVNLAARAHPEGLERKRFQREYLSDLELVSENESELQQLRFAFQTLVAAPLNTSDRDFLIFKLLVKAGRFTMLLSIPILGIEFLLNGSIALEFLFKSSATPIQFSLAHMAMVIGFGLVFIAHGGIFLALSIDLAKNRIKRTFLERSAIWIMQSSLVFYLLFCILVLSSFYPNSLVGWFGENVPSYITGFTFVLSQVLQLFASLLMKKQSYKRNYSTP